MHKLAISLAVVWFLQLSAPCQAGAITFQDDNFDDGDWWEEVVVRGPDGSGTGTAMRVASGGNPGAYREVYVERAPATAGSDNSTRMFSFASFAEYDPCVMGAIESVDMSLDGIQLQGGSGGALVPALIQGDMPFEAASQSLPEQDWTLKNYPGLTESSFHQVAMLSAIPDFSVTGGIIHFGFVYAVSTSTTQPVSRTVGFDNWNVAVTITDAPAFLIDAGLNGNWWNGLARNGEGVQIEVASTGQTSARDRPAGDDDRGLIMVATVYSYNLSGKQIFLVAVGPVTGNSAAVDVFITQGGLWGNSFDPELVEETQWGTGVFTACSCGLIRMTLTPNTQFTAEGYTTLSYDLERLTTPLTSCPLEGAG